METMSFRIGIDNYIYYNRPIPQNNGMVKEKSPTGLNKSNKYNKGEKNK